MFAGIGIIWTCSLVGGVSPVIPCLTSRTSPGGLFSHRPKQWLPLAHRMVVFSGETRPSPPATRSTSHCCCWSVKAHSLSSPCAAVKRDRLELSQVKFIHWLFLAKQDFALQSNKVHNIVWWSWKFCNKRIQRGERSCLSEFHSHLYKGDQESG